MFFHIRTQRNIYVLLSHTNKDNNSLGGTTMGRYNSQKPSGNKNSLPQTPKNLKIEPNRVDEEFSRELGLNVKIRPTRPK